MTFSDSTIAALVICMILAVLIPIAAVIVFKLKNRDARLPCALIGAGTFILFAIILEQQLLHSIMRPIVSGNAVAYVLYGILAAGIFEETGRLAAYKTIMKNNLTTKNAVMMGLGHGGAEMLLLLGFSMISLIGSAMMVNSDGLESVIRTLSAGNAEKAGLIREQLEALTAYNFGTMALSIYERLLAMTFHVCMSVIVFHAVTQPGKMRLYVLAVILHALFDVPAAMYQVGALSIPVVYIVMTIFTAIVVGLTITMTKRYSGRDEF